MSLANGRIVGLFDLLVGLVIDLVAYLIVGFVAGNWSEIDTNNKTISVVPNNFIAIHTATPKSHK